MPFFALLLPFRFDKTAINAASMLISLASASLKVASCFSSSSSSSTGAFEGRLQQLLHGFVVTEKKLIGIAEELYQLAQDEQGFRSEILAIQGPRLQGHNFASVLFFLFFFKLNLIMIPIN